MMYVDHRTYNLKPLKLGKWLALYEEAALPVQLKYLGNLIGFFQSEIGTLNQVVHLWGFDDLNERQRRRAEMAKDPAWLDFLRRNEELGALVHQESKILVPVRFSPIK
jgi:hypothetical protein